MIEGSFRAPCTGLLETLDSSNGDIYGIQGNNEYIVRIRKFWSKSPQEVAEKCLHGKALFDELREKYQIAVPRHDFVLSMNLASSALYVFADKIHGKRLLDPLNHPDEETLNNLFLGLVSYYGDKYRCGRSILPNRRRKADFLTDIKHFQFMYGHRSGEGENTIYLVDIDPMYSNASRPQSLVTSIAELVKMFDKVEMIFSYADLSPSYISLKKLLDSTKVKGSSKQWLDDLSKHLGNKQYKIGPGFNFGARL